MNKKLKVAFLWHHHQPYYKDELTQEYVLPWVRLHGVKDYYDTVSILDKYPHVKLNFNIVPSLLRQLSDYATGTAKDKFLILSEKKAKELTAEDKFFIRRNFFSCNKKTMIDPYPRYKELSEKKRFTVQDYLDLQVWFNLTWIDPTLRGEIKKDRNFTELEKQEILDRHLEIIKNIIPKYREILERGQIEISTTPFYHPILPILIDSSFATSQFKFTAKEDAAKQILDGINYYESIFGRKPKGMWPSEGAVSNEALNLISESGIKWVATDFDILKKSRDCTLAELYKPYKFNDLCVFFRDKKLSDLIGFSYSSMKAKDAVNDFFWHLYDIKNSLGDFTDEQLITIVLDGENCWEYFENDGTDFLNELYQRFEVSTDFETVLFSEMPTENLTKLPHIHAGSWINANFDVWIGDKEDHVAWNLLAQTRDFLLSVKEHKNLSKAWREIYIAEGSDWFWWYGDKFHSLNDSDFDEMFRQHLKNVYILLGENFPKELNVPNMSLSNKILGVETYQ